MWKINREKCLKRLKKQEEAAIKQYSFQTCLTPMKGGGKRRTGFSISERVLFLSNTVLAYVLQEADAKTEVDGQVMTEKPTEQGTDKKKRTFRLQHRLNTCEGKAEGKPEIPEEFQGFILVDKESLSQILLL
ncbi:hypothetical protein mRhiFer1_008821 [Rhinolophus ferrumequinum]|uniref:Uncharacterized protein n=1 Tax=Rhinolophus ferrumequinum TaxID=59479 RepID=A0A7J8AFY4_RHIFE|nr:hypothetical protein mRhiFer1_008821 [Rhinolophus ferrumequinum]